jgi:hypothetical protein
MPSVRWAEPAAVTTARDSIVSVVPRATRRASGLEAVASTPGIWHAVQSFSRIRKLERQWMHVLVNGTACALHGTTD